MRRGYDALLRAVVEGPQNSAKIETRLVLLGAGGEDIKATESELDTSAKTNLEAWNDGGLGALRLTATNTAVISYTTGSDAITTITSAWPRHILIWDVDPAVSDAAPLRSITLRLTRRNSGGSAPFDGTFAVTAWRVAVLPVDASGTAHYQLTRVADTLAVAASKMSADTANVDFAFATVNDATSPGAPVLSAFRLPPTLAQALPYGTAGGRQVVLTVEAQGGTNTNYALIADATAVAVTVTNVGSVTRKLGTQQDTQVRHEHALNMALRRVVAVSSGTGGLPRFSISTASYAATGTAVWTTANAIIFGALPTGTVEFVRRASVPTGTSLSTEVRATTTDAWTEFTDGATATSIGVTVTTTYHVKVSMQATSGLDATPTLYEIGARDRTVRDLSELATWESVSEDVDPRSGQGGVPEAQVRLEFTGAKDYRGVHRLLSENNLTDIAVEARLARADGTYPLLLDKWDVDDYELTASAARLTLVGVTGRMKGEYPTSSGNVAGYILKSTTATVSASGAVANYILSEATVTAATVAVTVAASSTAMVSWFTPVGNPGFLRWPPGDFDVEITTVTGNASITGKVRIVRVEATGSVIEYNRVAAADAWSEAQAFSTTTTTYTFQLNGTAWSTGTATDRMRVDLHLTNATATAVGMSFVVGSTVCETLAPWSFGTYREPAAYDSDSPASVFTHWRDTVVGLAERFRGDVPPDTVTPLSKNVMGADGLRELQRIAFCAGGAAICSQGRVSYRDLLALTGSVVAVFPLEHQGAPVSSHGFRSRQPVMRVPFGYDGAKFQGEVKVQHTAAHTAFGPSRITATDASVEADTAKWITEQELAARMGLQLVNGFACGFITHEFSPTVCHPHLELCDLVAVETDQLAFEDPVSTEPIRGPVWLVGRIIGRSGALNERLTVWCPGPSLFFGMSYDRIKRSPYEGPTVHPVDHPAEDRPTVARMAFEPVPAAASVFYIYLAQGVSFPDPVTEADQWTAYTAGNVVEFSRSTTAVKVVHVYATYQGIRGAVKPVTVQPAAAGTIDSLSGSESGTTVTWLANSASANVREIRWYVRATTTATMYPTADGTVNGILSETYYVNEKAILPSRGGGLSQAHTGVAYSTTTCYSACIAVPIDYNGNAGTRQSGAYTYAGSGTPSLSAATWTLNAAGSYPSTSRSYDFAWTGSGVVDGTHDLQILAQVDAEADFTLTTVTNPATVTGVTALEIGYYARTGDPDHAVTFRYELLAGSTVIASGYFSPPAGDTFQGDVVA